MSINVIEERHIISVLVDDEPGVLARVIGCFPDAAIISRA
jgi:acetolactate synthase small subunit